MDDVRKQKFESLLQDTHGEIERLDSEIEETLALVKEKLAGLQNEKKAQMVVYSGYCQLLGVPNEFEADEDDDEPLE